MIKTKALLWTAALLAVSVVAARAELLFTEEFPTAYGEGSVLGNNVTTGGFNTKWGTGNGAGQNGAICTSAGAMVHPTLATITNVQSYGFRAATGTSRDNRATFASQNSGSVYVSFLLKVTAETPTARILAGMRNSTGGGTQAAAMGINSSRQLTVYKNSSSSSATHPTVLNQNETYLVVFRLKFNSGSANDEVAVWLNPTTGGVDESTAGVTPTTTTANSDASSVTSLQLLSALDSSGALYLDEFRVGTDWIEVTPQAGPLVGANLACTTLQQVSFVGEAMHPVIVQVRTAGGLDVPSNNVSVTLALTAGSGNLNGTLTRLTDTNGRAIFDDLSFDTLGNGFASGFRK